MRTKNICEVPVAETAPEANLLAEVGGELKRVPHGNLKQAVSLKQLGAAGDGVTDDTLAVEQAFSGTYRAVYIPAGTYLVSRQIEVGSDLYVFGDGEASCLKLKAGAGEIQTTKDYPEPYRKIDLLHITGKSRVFFSRFCLDGNREGYAENPEGLEVCSRKDHVVCIAVQDTADIRLEDMTIRGSLIEGAYFYRCRNILISGCVFKENGFYQEDASGLHCDGSNENVVVGNCLSKENGFHGFLFAEIAGLSVSNCIADGNGYEGMMLQWGAKETVISNVVLKNNGRHGFLVKNDSYNVLVANAQIFGNGGNGLVVSGLDLLRASGLRITGNKGFGIYISKAGRVCLDSVTCEGNGRPDLYVYEGVPLEAVVLDMGASEIGNRKPYDDGGKTGIVGSIQPGASSMDGMLSRVFDPEQYPGEPENSGTAGSMVNPVMEIGSLSRTTGEEAEDTGNMRAADFIPVVPGAEYVFSNTAEVKIVLLLYDEGKMVLPGWNDGYNYAHTSSGQSRLIPSGARFCRFYVSGNTDTSIVFTVSTEGTAPDPDPSYSWFRKQFFGGKWSAEARETEAVRHRLQWSLGEQMKFGIEPDAVPALLTAQGLKVGLTADTAEAEMVTVPLAGLARMKNQAYRNAYTEAWIEERREEIAALLRQGDCILFVVNTDVHVFPADGDEGRFNQVRDTLLVAGEIPLDYICCLGDVLDESIPWSGREPRSWMLKQIYDAAGVPWFVTRGNHDFNSYGTDETPFTLETADSLLVTNRDWHRNLTSKMAGTRELEVVMDPEHPTYGYYYVDDHVNRHRMIFVLSNETHEENGRAYLDDAPSNCYINGYLSKHQAEWLLGKALDMTGKTDWIVTFFSHQAPYTDKGEADPSEFHGYGKDYLALRKIVKAFQTGTAVSTSLGVKDMEQHVSTSIAVEKDFSGQGPIAVTGWFAGHVHDDCYRQVDGLNLFVSTCTCPSVRSSYSNDPAYTKKPPERNDSNYAMSMNVICINKTTRAVHVIKLGSKRDNAVKTSSDYEFTY